MADPRLDPEMAAFNAMMEARAAALPPIRLQEPFDEPRALTEALNLPLAEGGPVMAESTDRWVPVTRPPHPVPGAPAGPAAARCPSCSTCMAAAGSGTASTRMTG